MVALIIGVVFAATLAAAWLYLRNVKNQRQADHQRNVELMREQEKLDAAPGSVDAAEVEAIVARDHELPPDKPTLPGDNAAQPPLNIPAAEALAERIKEAMNETLNATRKAQETCTKAGGASRTYTTSQAKVERWALTIGDTADKLRKSVDELAGLRRAAFTQHRRYAEATEEHRPNLEAAEQAMRRLSQLALQMPLPAQREQLPRELRVVFETAQLFIDQIRSQVRLLTEARSTTAELLPIARLPGVEDRPAELTKALSELDQALSELFTAYLAATKIGSDLGLAFYRLDHILPSTKIAEPQKPTEEEVRAYVAAFENWARETLHLQLSSLRQVDEFEAAGQRLQQAGTNLEKLCKVRTSGTEPLDEEAECLLRAVATVKAGLESQWESSYGGKVREWRARKLYDGSPTMNLNGDEVRVGEDLRNRARKLGFAVAQRNVANSKHSQADRNWRYRSSGPGKPSLTPEVTSAEAFIDAYLAYLGNVQAHARTGERLEAAQKATSEALTSRGKQVDLAARELQSAAEAASKQVGDKSSDEYRWLVMSVQRLAPLHVVPERKTDDDDRWRDRY